MRSFSHDEAQAAMERLRASLGQSGGVLVDLARFRDGWWIRADVYVDETGPAKVEIPPSVTGVPVQRRTIFTPSCSGTHLRAS